jgi:antitoxin (DNA-binding transcriptional repressor) of toxin-antitoxin stability system
VTRHGRPAVVVVAAEEYGRLRGRAGFKEFLRTAPDFSHLDIRRDRRPARKVAL